MPMDALLPSRDIVPHLMPRMVHDAESGRSAGPEWFTIPNEFSLRCTSQLSIKLVLGTTQSNSD